MLLKSIVMAVVLSGWLMASVLAFMLVAYTSFAGIGGHLSIADNVVILGRAMVTKSIAAAGIYGSGLPAMPARDWRKLVARVRRLQYFEQRLGLIEKELRLEPNTGDASEDDF